jgi:hypothetical protein
MSLPTPDLLLVAAETPTVVYRRQAYHFANTPTAAGSFIFEGAAYGLMKTERLADSERRFFALQAEAIEAFKTGYLRETVDTRIQAARELARRLRENRVLGFLMQELIPQFMELRLGKAGYERQKIERRARSIQRLLAHPEKRKPLTGALLAAELDRTLILDGKVYSLVEVSVENSGDLCLHLEGRLFALGVPPRFLKQVQESFAERLANYLCGQALAESPERLRCLREIEREQQEWAEFLAEQPPGPPTAGRRYLYHDSERGILQEESENVFYVYLEVPEYVVEAADGGLYRFEATRVGVRLDSSDPAAILKAGRAVVLTPYEHMFVSGKNAGESLCMVRGDGYYAELRTSGLAEGLLAYLHDAKQTLMAGHHARNDSTPYHPISSFGHRRISRDEAEQKQLPIYCYYR